jgi:hypothetical protein
VLDLLSPSRHRAHSRRERAGAAKQGRARRLLLESLGARRVMAFSPFSELNVGNFLSFGGDHIVQVAGDFTGNHRTDLVVSGDLGLALLRGNGDGTFQPPVVITPSRASSLVAADMNSDGKLDLVTATGVLLGNGDGTFQSPLAIELPPLIPDAYPSPLAQIPGSVAVGDLNGDGKLDVTIDGNAWIFDVQLLPGIRFPEVLGFQKETLDHTFIIPPGF